MALSLSLINTANQHCNLVKPASFFLATGHSAVIFDSHQKPCVIRFEKSWEKVYCLAFINCALFIVKVCFEECLTCFTAWALMHTLRDLKFAWIIVTTHYLVLTIQLWHDLIAICLFMYVIQSFKCEVSDILSFFNLLCQTECYLLMPMLMFMLCCETYYRQTTEVKQDDHTSRKKERMQNVLIILNVYSNNSMVVFH